MNKLTKKKTLEQILITTFKNFSKNVEEIPKGIDQGFNISPQDFQIHCQSNSNKNRKAIATKMKGISAGIHNRQMYQCIAEPLLNKFPNEFPLETA